MSLVTLISIYLWWAPSHEQKTFGWIFTYKIALRPVPAGRIVMDRIRSFRQDEFQYRQCLTSLETCQTYENCLFTLIDLAIAYEIKHSCRATKSVYTWNSVRQLCCLEGRNASKTKLSFVVNITDALEFFRLLVGHNVQTWEKNLMIFGFFPFYGLFVWEVRGRCLKISSRAFLNSG